MRELQECFHWGWSVPATVGNPEGQELYFHLSGERFFICDQIMYLTWEFRYALLTLRDFWGKLPVATVTMEAVFPSPWFLLLESPPLGSLYILGSFFFIAVNSLHVQMCDSDFSHLLEKRTKPL